MLLGIYFYRNSNRVVFTNVTFINNFAGDGGGFYGYYDNTAIDFIDCKFIDNMARDGGGGFFLYQNNERMQLLNCLFEGNEAGWQGGAVESRTNDKFRIEGCRFLFNSCNLNEGGGVNFGIDNGELSVSYSTFIGNYATTDGGGLYLGANNFNFIISDNTFLENIADNYGGGMAFRSNNLRGSLARCTFRNNRATVAGASIHSALRNSDMKMTNMSFHHNIAASYAGGVYFGNDHSNITFKEGYFEGSRAQDGAALYVGQFNTDFDFSGLIFESNTANVKGGAVIVYANKFTISDSEFYNNIAAAECGGLYIGEASMGSSHSVVIRNCTFIGNTGSNNHGALEILDRQGVRVSDSYFERNHATAGVGGAITIGTSSNVKVEGVTVYDNDCLAGGGAFNILGVDQLTISNCTIEKNRAIKGAGGAMRTQMTSGLRILSVSMNNNYAYTEGGAMHLSGVEIALLNFSSDVVIEDSIIDNNYVALGSGSAIWISQCYLEVNRNSFSFNRAPMGGGTLYWMVSSGMAEPTSSGNHWSLTNYGLYGSKWATEAIQFDIMSEDQHISESNPLNVTDYDAAISLFTISLVDFYGQLIRNDNKSTVDVTVESNTMCTDYMDRYNVSGYVAGKIVLQYS